MSEVVYSSRVKVLLRSSLLLLLMLGLARAITREEILETARDFAELSWSADSANTTAWDSIFALYGCEEHLTSDWKAGETYQGMAYSFGGNDDTLSYLENLACSLAAGNHMCHYQNYGAATGIYPPDWSTGIDCSAFVCRCWEVPRTNTGGIYDNYYPVEKEDVQSGDVLVKPSSHVILIADPGETPGSGTFALYEASGSACRVWFNPEASWSYYSSYSARSLFDSSEIDPEDDCDTIRIRISVEMSVARDHILLRFPNVWDTQAISFEIFNVLGERVYSGEVRGPEFQMYWDGLDEQGRRLPSGVYGVRSISPGRSLIERFILIK